MKVDQLPENQMFKSFCDNFHYVDTSGPVMILKLDNKDELVSFYTDMLLKKKRTVPSSTEMTFGIYVIKILIFCNQNIVREICFSRKDGKGKKARLIFKERETPLLSLGSPPTLTSPLPRSNWTWCRASRGSY